MLRLRPILLLAAFVLLSISTVSGLTAANNVPPTHAGDSSRVAGANDLKPPECASLNLTNRISGSGSVSGTTANDLITGAAGADTMAGDLGDDCHLGGAGDDDIDGGLGTDVCIGGPGTDTFTRCETEIQ